MQQILSALADTNDLAFVVRDYGILVTTPQEAANMKGYKISTESTGAAYPSAEYGHPRTYAPSTYSPTQPAQSSSRPYDATGTDDTFSTAPDNAPDNAVEVYDASDEYGPVDESESEPAETEERDEPANIEPVDDTFRSDDAEPEVEQSKPLLLDDPSAF